MSQPYRGMSYRTPHWYMSHTDWNILIEEYHGQVPIGSGHVPIRLIKHLIITYPTRIETYSANNSGKALLPRGVLDLYIYIYILYRYTQVSRIVNLAHVVNNLELKIHISQTIWYMYQLIFTILLVINIHISSSLVCVVSTRISSSSTSTPSSISGTSSSSSSSKSSRYSKKSAVLSSKTPFSGSSPGSGAM